MPKRSAKEGFCQLTKEWGPFVDSHIVPKALTKSEWPGVPFVEHDNDGGLPRRRWSSWYDNQLVIAKGEEQLRNLDTWAIEELRRVKLIWSSWGPMTQPPGVVPTSSELGWGYREIDFRDPKRLRLFFHSLLWRAAASKRRELSDITLAPDELERIRLAIIGELELDDEFFPVSLIQISTVGEIHNNGPSRLTKEVRDWEGDPETVLYKIPFFRFYFEGLVAHLHIRGEQCDGWGPVILGREKLTFVNTQTYELSLQRVGLERARANAWMRHPDVMMRLKPK